MSWLSYLEYRRPHLTKPELQTHLQRANHDLDTARIDLFLQKQVAYQDLAEAENRLIQMTQMVDLQRPADNTTWTARVEQLTQNLGTLKAMEYARIRYRELRVEDAIQRVNAVQRELNTLAGT